MSHAVRAHSKLSASGAERYFNCPGSVALSEGMVSKDTPASLEGTRAHEVLESVLTGERLYAPPSPEMYNHALRTAAFITSLEKPKSEFLVETRVHLPFIHPEMFGTFDSAIVNHFGELHVFDYKYGKHPASPIENLQMIFYGMGLAARYDWNFTSVRMWILQPRLNNYSSWKLDILALKQRIQQFKKAVKRVIDEPTTYKEGSWCFFCVAKGKCPLKQQKREKEAMTLFSPVRRKVNG